MAAVRTVLVIDDDPNIRETLQIALQDVGFRVISARDGEDGISRAVAELPDLVIVDMMMPRASGFTVIERLKQKHQLRMPVIMLTGNESDHQRAYAEFLGVDCYLTKPVRPFQLFQAVGQFCPPPLPAPSYGRSPMSAG